jgi:hypothetical protein
LCLLTDQNCNKRGIMWENSHGFSWDKYLEIDGKMEQKFGNLAIFFIIVSMLHIYAKFIGNIIPIAFFCLRYI